MVINTSDLIFVFLIISMLLISIYHWSDTGIWFFIIRFTFCFVSIQLLINIIIKRIGE